MEQLKVTGFFFLFVFLKDHNVTGKQDKQKKKITEEKERTEKTGE